MRSGVLGAAYTFAKKSYSSLLASLSYWENSLYLGSCAGSDSRFLPFYIAKTTNTVSDLLDALKATTVIYYDKEGNQAGSLSGKRDFMWSWMPLVIA